MSFTLLIVVVLSWGFSWYAIELQIGEVPALVSITYRFILAAAMLFAFLFLTGKYRHIPLKQHGMVAALGFCLFSMNFMCFYLAASYFPSGLLSVIFATAAIMGAFNQKLFFGRPLNFKVLLGAAFGLLGLILLSWTDIITAKNIPPLVVVLPFFGTYLFSLGNLISARLSQDRDLPTVVAYGMTYGAVICLTICLVAGLPFPLPSEPIYWGALIYLAAIASVLAFLTYLSLVKREGPARAAYATVLFPIVAMLVSTWLEGYQWTIYSALGLFLALGGTALVFKRPKTA